MTIGMQRQEFRDKRRRLIEALPDQSICIIPGFGLRYMVEFVLNSPLIHMN
jgi:hypothetical protein